MPNADPQRSGVDARRLGFGLPLDDQLWLRLTERHHAPTLFTRIDAERDHLAGAFGWARTATPASIQARVAAALEQFRRGEGWHAELYVDAEPIGALWLHDLQGAGGSTEIGYWVGRAWQGRGLLTRALEGLHRHFFEGRSLGRVSIAVDPRNARSRAVAERLGYEPEAVLRNAYPAPDGRPGHLAFYGLLGEHWQARHRAGAREPLALPRFALRVDDDLVLGLLERDDVAALADLVDAEREHLRPWMPWAGDLSAGATRGFVEGRALPAIAAADGFETGIWWRGRLVGACGLHTLYREPMRGSLGYWLAADAQGHGIATRAMRTVTAKAFDDLGFERVDLRADVANTRSRAVADRLGFTFEGVLRRELWNGQAYVDAAVYGVLRSEWRERSSGGAAR
ncbi:MAG: N-acetyltransferase [Trueperaceae bacterium]|nr:MAG: N-acetyltransferase [Trueperaceae bacterium]